MADDHHPAPKRPGVVIAGVVPGQSSRVLRAAARQAALAGTDLVVAHVDTTRFVAFEDPDGYVSPSTVDVVGAAAKAALSEVQAAADSVLADAQVSWSVRQVIGDPALALIHLADELDASLLVVGTRKRGLGSRCGSSSPGRSPRGSPTGSGDRCWSSRWVSRSRPTRSSSGVTLSRARRGRRPPTPAAARTRWHPHRMP